MFASKTDIQTWLQTDKILVDDANSNKPNIEAARIIRGSLAGVYAPIVIASWADPDSTPELIRGIAGRLAAAILYSSIYSEEARSSEYGMWLYSNAMADLAQIAGGLMTVTDGDGNPIDTQGSGLLSFFPDNTTTPTFTMSKFFS